MSKLTEEKKTSQKGFLASVQTYLETDSSSVDVTTVKGFFQKTVKNITGKCFKNPQSDDSEGVIVIHMHGGGFVAMSSASMRILIRPWCKTLNMVHFSIDYRLAPKDPYPAALDDVWQAYLWILNYCESILGILRKLPWFIIIRHQKEENYYSR